jgi:hypothetical protein
MARQGRAAKFATANLERLTTKTQLVQADKKKNPPRLAGNRILITRFEFSLDQL